MPFSLSFDDDLEFTTSGRIILARNGKGLNCSTFVLHVFRQYGIPLVDFDTWQARSEDAEWHRSLVEWVKHDDPEHAALIESEIGCARVRPEEVAGAALDNELPVSFEHCVHNGQAVLAFVDSLSGSIMSCS